MEPLTDSQSPVSLSSSSSSSPSADGTERRGALATVALLALTRDKPVRELMMEIAIEHGYGYYCADDLADAMRMIEEERPALVLADIDVPDGRVLVRTLHGGAGWRDIPIVGLTATNNPMMAVALDVPVFFKPSLDGLEEALLNRFTRGGGRPPPTDFPTWLGPPPKA